MLLSSAVMRDGVAAFYDPYASPFSVEGRLGLRYRRSIPLVSNQVLALAVAAVALLAFVVADVGAFEAVPVKVTVTQVQWMVGNFSLANGSGFTVRAGTEFPLRAVCEVFCVPFTAVTVNAPFSLLNATIAYPYYEYVNVTIRAPAHAYSGPVTLDLAF